MSDLQKVVFDGASYYQAEDVDQLITGLEAEAEDLEVTIEDAQEECEGLRMEIECAYFSEEDNKKLKSLLQKCASVLGDFEKQDYEVNFNGRVTDISGFISNIEWELKE